MRRAARVGGLSPQAAVVLCLLPVAAALVSLCIGRMGLPYREKGIHIISIAMDAPQDKISALAGKIGKIPGITSRATYANMGEKKS